MRIPLLMFSLTLVGAPVVASPAWRPDATRTVVSASWHRAVTQALPVRLDWQIAHAEAASLDLPLPDGRVVRAERRSVERRGDADWTWVGVFDGDAEQQVVLTRVGEHASAYLSLDSGIHELTPTSDGPLLLKLDTDRFPGCGGALTPPATASADESPGTAVDPAEPTRTAADLMDVLVVFSPGSVAQLGGQAQAQAFAQGAVDSSNQAFANSQIKARFRLAGVRFTARADSGNSSTDLTWLRGDSEVAAWRNETRADMVGLIAEFSNACGQGYLMGNPPGPGFAPNAFQVTARNCAIGNLSYAHEHGHNMGLQHNPENGSGPAYPYAFGHWVNGNFRTVMSYSNPCTSGCTRRPYFSNPAVSFNGAATGVADQRDNARAISNTARIVAGFRVGEVIFANGFD
ncbi:MAG: M12 family metallo-peptidase [Xanthomonadales bacterium]|jgi:hypothetical protein|nr:M12 family metallo-peptidase [Xanthomonadales bacterium]